MNEAIEPTEEHPSTVRQSNDTPSHSNVEDNTKHASDEICEGQTPSKTSPYAEKSNELSGDTKDPVISNCVNASTSRKKSRGIRTYTQLSKMHCDIIGKDFWLEHPYILGKAKR